MDDGPKAYLVVASGLHGVYLDEDLARTIASAIEGVVVAAPIVADYRAGADRG